MSKCELLDPSTDDDNYLFWLVVERHDDPEKSIFSILKRVKTKSVYHPIQKVVRERLLGKSYQELTYEDFVDNFVIYFSKKHSLNAKSNVYDRKINILLEEMFKTIFDKLEVLKPKEAL